MCRPKFQKRISKVLDECHFRRINIKDLTNKKNSKIIKSYFNKKGGKTFASH